jgi:tetratricopeptide (TPR) repeat protein
MANSDSSNLYELITSLTKAERKTFTLFANLSNDSRKKYLVLFEIISSQKKYDEGKIQRRLTELNILTPLPVLKNYVQEILLKALRFHHDSVSIDSILHNLIMEADLMHAKGLEKIRDKLMRKAKALAKNNERKEVLLEILNKEWNYKTVFNPKEIELDHSLALEDLSKLLFARTMTFNVSLLLEKGEIRDDSLKSEWETIVKNPIMTEERKYSGYEENCHFHHNWMRYYHRTNDFQKCTEHQVLLIKHMESRPDLLRVYRSLYIFELNGLVVAYCQLKDYLNARITLNKILQISELELNTPERNMLADTLAIAYGNIIHGYYLSDFDSAVQASEEAERYLESINIQHHHAAFLYLNLAKTNIYIGNFKKALIWTNHIFHDSPGNRRDDFYVIAWVFNIIIHFELDHIDFLPSLIKSTGRFLKKRNRLYKTETTILHFLQTKLPKSSSKKSIRQFYAELLIEMKEIVKDPYEAKAFKYFDFISWLESKIQSKSIAEVVKSKIKELNTST